MPNFIDEYLIRLGTSVDSAGIARFQTALREASSMVDASAFSMTKSMFKAQTEIVGGFAAIGGAAIGLADKVAMADQEYRLFALHMYMSKDAARSLKVAMDALGQPLENLSWDTELRERTRQLIEDQRAMAPGGDFEDGMRKIRDIRFEFTRMEVELQYLGMHFVQDFMQSLGTGPDEFLTKLRRFNEWVIVNMPAISHALATEFLPIWRDIEHVFTATGKALEESVVLFTNLIGLLSGDRSLEGTTLSLDKLAKAIEHIAYGFAWFAETIANVEESLMHFTSGMSLLSSGDWKGASSEFGAGADLISTRGAITAAGAVAGFLTAGPVGAAAGAGAGWNVGGVASSLVGAQDRAMFAAALARDPSAANNIPGLITSMASILGLDVNLAHALAYAESGENQYAVSSTGAVGVMQLMAGTAKGLGVNRFNTGENILGGLELFSQLLKEYGNVPTAIAAYHEGEPKMNAILAGKATLSDEGRGEVARIMSLMGKTGTVNVGTIVIQIPEKHATNEGVGNAVVAKLKDMQGKQTQRNLLEFQALGSSY